MIFFKRGMKNTSHLLIGTLATQIVNIAGFTYIARSMGPETYGLYISVGAFVSVFYIFTFDGLNKALLRNCSECPESIDRILTEALGMKLVFILVAVALCIASSFVWSGDTARTMLIVLFSSDLFLRGITTYIRTVYQATEEMKYISIFNILSGVGATVGSVIALILGADLMVFILVRLGIRSLVLVLNFITSRKLARIDMPHRIVFDPEVLKPAFRFSLIVFLGTLATKIDLLMISQLGSDAEVGIYGVAYKIVERMNVLRNLVATAFFPVFVKRFEHGMVKESLFLKYSLIMLISIGMLAVIFIMYAEQVIAFVLGIEYIGSARILALLVAAQAFVWISIPYTTAAQATHNESILLLGTGIAATLNIPLNYYLYHSNGIVGIAYSTLIVVGASSIVIVLKTHAALKKSGKIGT